MSDVIDQINAIPIREYVERNPASEQYDSLRIFENTNTWHRFSTGHGSSVLDWAGYQRYGESWDKRSGITELVSSIASDYGFEMNGYDPAIAAERKLIANVYLSAAAFYALSLEDNHVRHLSDNYGFSEQFIIMHQFGYAPTSGLIQWLKKAGFSIADMLKSGLVVESKSGKHYEYFRGRLMFPYWRNGEIANFIGRETDETPQQEITKKQKYRKIAKHSKFYFHASELIQHNAFIGEDSIAGSNSIYLCEGTTDALLAIQYGYSAVSPGGTGYSQGATLRALDMTQGRDTYIAFDADARGQEGARKLATALWESDVVAQVLMLKSGDLNDYLRNGGNIADVPRKNIIELVCSGDDKAEAIKEVGRLISCLTKEYLRDEYKELAARLIDVPATDIETPGALSEHEIQVNDRQFNLIVDDALDAMMRRNEASGANPPFLVNNGQLCRVISGADGIPSLHMYKNSAFKIELSRSADWMQITQGKRGERKSDARPPSDLCEGILQSGMWEGIPDIRVISKIPLFDADGALHESYGYHSQVRAFIHSPEYVPMDINRAKDLILNNMYVDFPFSDQASIAHTVAQLIQPFVRQMINGVVPAYITTAPERGTGKSLLADLAGIVAEGHEFKWQSAPDNNDEWRKLIVSLLVSGDPFICIDNCSSLESDALAGMITAHFYKGRILGKTDTIAIPNEDKTLILNGNNVILSKDLIRRCVLIRLDSESAQPWNRQSFKHEYVAKWAKEHRAELIGACIAIINGWIDAGMPKYSGKRRGSFESWSNVIGGILESAGIEGFLKNDETLIETSEETGDDEWYEFVDAWADMHGETPVTVNELMPIASYDEDNSSVYDSWKNTLTITLGGGGESTRKRRLAMLLGQKRDAVIGDYKILLVENNTRKKGAKKYYLRSITSELLDDLDI